MFRVQERVNLEKGTGDPDKIRWHEIKSVWILVCYCQKNLIKNGPSHTEANRNKWKSQHKKYTVSKSHDCTVLERYVSPPTTPYYIRDISPPPAPEPPTRPISTIQGAAVRVHLHWSRPAAAEHCWQRVMPGRQLSKHCPVARTEPEQQYNGKSVQTAPFLCYQGGKAHRGNKKPFMCVYQFNYPKLWKRGHWAA